MSPITRENNFTKKKKNTEMHTTAQKFEVGKI